MSDSSAYPWMYYYDQKEFQEAMPSLMEVWDWTRGVVMGEFNEDPKVSQIIADMAISFAPYVGEACDIRDIIAVLLRWYNDPRKMQDLLEWVTFAGCAIGLVPVVGWPLKTTARFIVRHPDDVVRMVAVLIALLNRTGVGDAETWLQITHFVDYHQQLLEKLTEFLNGFIDILRSCLDAPFPLIGDLREHLKDLADWLTELRDNMGEPLWKALKYLEEYKTKIAEAVGAGRGDVILAASGITRCPESKPLLAERPRKDSASLKQKKFEGLTDSEAKDWIQNNNDALKALEDETKHVDNANFRRDLQAFTKFPQVVKLTQEETFFRVYGDATPNPRLAAEGEDAIVAATKPGGCWWGVGKLPKTAKEWRELFAVLDCFNANGKAVEITIKKGEIPAIKGGVAEQRFKKGAQILPGGGEQILITPDIAKEIDGAITKALDRNITSGSITLKSGAVVEFTQKSTGWKDVNGKYGWRQGLSAPLARTSRDLAPTEERPKGEDIY